MARILLDGPAAALAANRASAPPPGARIGSPSYPAVRRGDQVVDPRGWLHGLDPGHRAGRQRRRHPRERPGAHHRLPDHRGRGGLADQPPTGASCPAHALAYDQETGFGLVQALGPLDLPALDLGDAADARRGRSRRSSPAATGQFVRAKIVTKQEFAGYWEYLLDEAIFTAPAHPIVGRRGADRRRRQAARRRLAAACRWPAGARPHDINMIVPIDLLPPILDDLLDPRPDQQAAAALARRLLRRKRRQGRGA